MKIDYTVDKRTELLGVLLLISDYNELYPRELLEGANKEYRNKIFQKFSQFKEEKAVVLFNRIIKELNFSYDAQPCLFLQLNEDFGFEELENYPFHTRLKESKLVLEFLKELPAFAEKIEFEKYYNSNKNFHNEIIEKANKNVNPNLVNDFMQSFYKVDLSNKHFVVNFLPFISYSNFGFEIVSKNLIYCNPGFDPRDKELNFLNEGDDMLLRHEFAHPIVNPLTAKYANLPFKFFEKDKDVLLKQGYNLGNVVLNEYVIRAVELICLKHYLKDSNYETLLEREKGRGFSDIELFVEILEQYYFNINKYKDFEEFYPILVKKIEAYYEKGLEPN